MGTHSRLLLVGLAAALLLSAAVASASANSLSVSNRSFRTTWSSLEFFTIAGTMRCPITMEGSFHSATFSKVTGALVGYVSRSTIASASCTGGTATVNQEALPWHLRYRGFAGTLPRITGVGLGLIGAKFTGIVRGFSCITQTSVMNPWSFTASVGETGAITGLGADESASIPLRGSFICELIGSYTQAGTGSVTQLGTTSSISLTLITPKEPPRLSPVPVDFGRIEAGGLARRTVTITAGDDMLTVNSMRIPGGQYFTVIDPNRCTGARLAERGACSFTVIFAAPSEAGRSVEETLVVETTVRRLEATVRGST